MQTERGHSLILGAGPSGLSARLYSGKCWTQRVVLAKDKVPSSLMPSIKYGDFIMDVGRKELYNRKQFFQETEHISIDESTRRDLKLKANPTLSNSSYRCRFDD